MKTHILGVVMNGIDKKGVGIGIIGGFGLGLLLGKEFSGTYITLTGAALVIVALLLMVGFSVLDKKR